MESRKSKSTENDDIIDEENEYYLLYDYVHDGNESTDNHLKFNGDIELAKKYEEEEAASALIDLYNRSCDSIDDDESMDENDAINPKDECMKSDVNDNQNEEQKNHIDLNSSSQVQFTLARYSPPQIQITTFQQRHEPRMKYLLRSLKLWQEFINSGDMDKLNVLFNDILAEDFLRLSTTSPPIVGRQKWRDYYAVLLRNIPDYCVFFTNIVRTKRRVIILRDTSFGTVPYIDPNDKSTVTWNIFEHTPIEKLDEHHKIQKQKYEALKLLNRPIKFERTSFRYLMLTRDLKRILKLMASNVKIDVF